MSCSLEWTTVNNTLMLTESRFIIIKVVIVLGGCYYKHHDQTTVPVAKSWLIFIGQDMCLVSFVL